MGSENPKIGNNNSNPIPSDEMLVANLRLDLILASISIAINSIPWCPGILNGVLNLT